MQITQKPVTKNPFERKREIVTFTPKPVEELIEGKRDGEAVTVVAIDRISANPWQYRTVFDEVALGELAASIREHGLLQAVIVTPNPAQPGCYWLIAGERRYRASGRAGLTEIPVVVRDASPEQMAVLALIENGQREQPNAMDEARGYARLASEFGLSVGEIVERTGKAQGTISNALRLLDLPSVVQEAVSGGWAASNARLLVGLSDSQAAAIYEQAAARNLGRDEIEKLVKRAKKSRSANRNISGKCDAKNNNRNKRKALIKSLEKAKVLGVSFGELGGSAEVAAAFELAVNRMILDIK